MEKFGEWKHVNQIGHWRKNGEAVWTIEVYAAGCYYLDLRYRGNGKLVWRTVTDEGIAVQNQQAATEKYQSYPMSIIEFAQAGRHALCVSLLDRGSGCGEPCSRVDLTDCIAVVGRRFLRHLL